MIKKQALTISGKFKGQDILSLDQFTAHDIQKVLRVAKKLKPLRTRAHPSKILSGNIITLLFYEPSSRTFSSFASAAQQLGAGVVGIHDAKTASSVAKGESLSDTVKTLESYSDLIVMRHPVAGSTQEAADACVIPVINAGDGTREHPTQTLLDLYTLLESKGKLQSLTGVIAGDLVNGRTAKSFIRGLSLFKNNTLYLLSPVKLKLSREEFKLLAAKGIKLVEITTEKDMPKNADFWYWTRIQKERFATEKEYNAVKNSLILTPQLAKTYAGKKTIFMHPLPRTGEIDTAVDSDPRALYLKVQMRNGVYVRMALLALLLGKIT